MNSPVLYDIHGTVWRPDMDILMEEFITRLEAAESVEELERIFGEFVEAEEDLFKRQPVPDVVVTLQGKSIVKRAATDAQGRFRFVALPRGEYELCAEGPARSPRTGEKQTVRTRKRVKVDNDSLVDLELRADLVSVRGRITDVDGRPVAGARVTTEFDDPVDRWGKLSKRRIQQLWVYASTRSTLSDADGFYELQWLEPSMNYYRLAGFLYGGNPINLRWVNIRVEADGSVQGKDNVPKVPLVSEQGLDWGRRFMRVLVRHSEEDLREKEDLPLPFLQGNTITGIDIVLKGGVGAE